MERLAKLEWLSASRLNTDSTDLHKGKDNVNKAQMKKGKMNKIRPLWMSASLQTLNKMMSIMFLASNGNSESERQKIWMQPRPPSDQHHVDVRTVHCTAVRSSLGLSREHKLNIGTRLGDLSPALAGLGCFMGQVPLFQQLYPSWLVVSALGTYSLYSHPRSTNLFTLTFHISQLILDSQLLMK